MMIACGKDNLNPEELQSCLDAFDEGNFASLRVQNNVMMNKWNN